MSIPDRKTLDQHLTDLGQRIDALRTMFYHIESEFNRAFQSNAKRQRLGGFVELGLFRQMLARYVEWRNDSEVLSRLTERFGDLADADSRTSRLGQLDLWLGKLLCYEEARRSDLCFTTWQRISEAFLSFIDIESRVLPGVSPDTSGIQTHYAGEDGI